MRDKIDKILAAFGNIRAMERLHVDDYTENIIKSIDTKPFGISNKNVIYATSNELGGYYYLKTTIVGSFHIKTFKGATLTLKTTDSELVLKSDMSELESDFSNVSGQSITNIDFEIEENAIKSLNASKIEHILLLSKKSKVEFLPFEDKNPTS
jgi:hypothetical protein